MDPVCAIGSPGPVGPISLAPAPAPAPAPALTPTASPPTAPTVAPEIPGDACPRTPCGQELIRRAYQHRFDEQCAMDAEVLRQVAATYAASRPV